MPIDPSIREHLLESQVREIDQMISTAGFPEYEWGRCAGEFAGYISSTTPCVYFPGTEYYFSFAHLPTSFLESAMARSRYGKNSGEHWAEFSPGAEGPREIHREMRWEEAVYYFDRWLSYVARELGVDYKSSKQPVAGDPSRTLTPTPVPPRATTTVARDDATGQVAFPAPPVKPLDMPEKITLRWVIDHAPLNLWAQVVGAAAIVFLAGAALGTTDVILQIRDKDVPKLEHEIKELRRDSAAVSDSVVRLLKKRDTLPKPPAVLLPDRR